VCTTILKQSGVIIKVSLMKDAKMNRFIQKFNSQYRNTLNPVQAALYSIDFYINVRNQWLSQSDFFRGGFPKLFFSKKKTGNNVKQMQALRDEIESEKPIDILTYSVKVSEKGRGQQLILHLYQHCQGYIALTQENKTFLSEFTFEKDQLSLHQQMIFHLKILQDKKLLSEEYKTHLKQYNPIAALQFLSSCAEIIKNNSNHASVYINYALKKPEKFLKNCPPKVQYYNSSELSTSCEWSNVL
jgi:hypothetical protein